ncbi:MAG: hypothetical protein IT579_11930 [Verrucomicrobia subdivision 3 bacterium]|nr:hypothetical protein [Verrucomicrobiota bacterium]MCC6821432.1 hypothetical protein [Limisphaerales bacterium]
MNTPNLRISVFPTAVALALLFAVANATALTKSASGGTNAAATIAVAPVAKTPAANPNLTSAATVSAPTAPVLGDIRDIRQPRHFSTPWLWVVIAAGVVSLIAAAYAAWQWLQHGKYFEMVPSEIALQRLDEARRLMDPDQAREYCFAVSKIIRSYLEDQWHLHAPRLTTEEFLRELVEGSDTIAAPHRALLSDFLQHCDLAKFAGWRYSLPALAEMHGSAVDFVTQSSVAPTKVANTQATPAPTASPTPKPERTLTHKA